MSADRLEMLCGFLNHSEADLESDCGRHRLGERRTLGSAVIQPNERRRKSHGRVLGLCPESCSDTLDGGVRRVPSDAVLWVVFPVLIRILVDLTLTRLR